jgi:predicted N-acetyltransferase YhbS
VIGYFGVAAASIEPKNATSRAACGQGRQPIPAVLLGRLAVDVSIQGNGIGGALLVEALMRAAAASRAIGARVVLVHALDERARRFYMHYGFEPSPTDSLHLMVLMKDLRKTIRAVER